MANLTYTEKEAFEYILDMAGGYVSDFSNRQFADFMFTTNNIQIYSTEYSCYGNSKANRLRAFWDLKSDIIVGKILHELITREFLKNKHLNKSKLQICKKAVARLLGLETSEMEYNIKSEEDLFLEQDFKNLNLSLLEIDSCIISIIEERIKEIQSSMKNGNSLSAIILMGSTLEGILLGYAIKNISQYNQTKCSPKSKDGKTLKLYNWSLANLIDSSRELNFIGEDVSKFSHVLRDFRNFVHPYHQLNCRFTPDSHTVRICWQVLQAAIFDLTIGVRKNGRI